MADRQSVRQQATISEDPQAMLVSAMLAPGFYPKPPVEVTHKETHISHLFFAGDLVYKIKKAVRFSFLDYSTLAKRRHFLQEELRLNRRLAPSVYLAVMPITLDEPGWRLGGWGQPAEYTLIMRRLPDRRMLPFLLESGQVTAGMMRELAAHLASFHTQAERARGVDISRYPQAVAKQWQDNLADLEPFVGEFIAVEMIERLRSFGRHFVIGHRDLFARRAAAGWIRDVHGDLHCEHVCFAPEGIQIFDCIEFSAKLRCSDLASEIAFLLMDLECRGGAALGAVFLTRYLELMDDRDLPALLPFYQCHRALVRAKVAVLRAPEMVHEASRYLRLAGRFTWEPLKPFVVLVCGLTGSGKSTLARELGERLGLPVINSDAVRKTMAGKLARQTIPFNQGIYSPAMTEKTYAAMARRAKNEIVKGKGAIVDATFGQRAHRNKVVRLAEKYQVPIFLIRCSACEETTKKRLTQRAAEGIDISDGRWEIYLDQKAAFQPMDDIPPADCLELDTEPALDTLALACERFLCARLANPPV
jgi:aminoglycoside phosphotransferase family enzyme/predicted kinase